jgi:hypothetical protein
MASAILILYICLPSNIFHCPDFPATENNKYAMHQIIHMHFSIKMLVIILVIMIFFLIVILLSGGWFGQLSDIANNLFGWMKSIDVKPK